MKRLKPPAPGYRPLVLFAVGFVAVALAQSAGWLANTLGADGTLVGIPFAQAVIFFALFYHKHLGLPELRWGCCIFKGLVLGAIAWIVSTALAGAFSWGMEELFKIQFLEQPAVSRLRIASQAEFAYLAMLAGFVAPICEEIYFRGWWMTYAREKLSPFKANFIVALAFALLHGDWMLLPGLLAAGMIFGVAAMRWGLNSAIAAHLVFNFVTIMAARGGWL